MMLKLVEVSSFITVILVYPYLIGELVGRLYKFVYLFTSYY